MARASNDGRGSADAIRKRRAARALNSLLTQPEGQKPLDGRTEIRRKRLLAELQSNTNNRAKPLKPVDVMAHVDELLLMGESAARLRKFMKVPVAQANADPAALVLLLRELQAAYGFQRETYEVLGFSQSILDQAAVASRNDRGLSTASSEKPRTRRPSTRSSR